jgi:hypothetical protein
VAQRSPFQTHPAAEIPFRFWAERRTVLQHAERHGGQCKDCPKEGLCKRLHASISFLLDTDPGLRAMRQFKARWRIPPDV